MTRKKHRNIPAIISGIFFAALLAMFCEKDSVYAVEDFSYSDVAVGPDSSTPAANGGLTSDLTINGNYVIKSDLYLNGHTLTVIGDLKQSAGNLIVGSGKLIVNGSYTIGGSYGGDIIINEAGSGGLWMTDPAGLVDVDGDFSMTSTAECAGKQTAGVLRIGGDLLITRCDEHAAFAPSGNHIVDFKGSKEHRLWFRTVGQYVSCKGENRNHLNIVTQSGTGPLKPFLGFGMAGGETSGFILGSDIVCSEVGLTGKQPLNLNGHKMIINSDYTLKEITVNVNGGQLTINGTLYQPSGILNVGTGKIHVKKNYELDAGWNFSNGTGELWMTQAGGLLEVDGYMDVKTSVKHKKKLTNGAVLIGDNLNIHASDAKGYVTSKKHITAFKGRKEHKATVPTGDRISNIMLDVGGSLRFPGYELNGLKSDFSRKITSSKKSVASIDEYLIKAKKAGTSIITFKNAKGSVKTPLIVGSTSSLGKASVPSVKKPARVKLKASSQKLTLSWKKLGGIDGYQIQISTKASFPKAKTITVKSKAKKYVLSKENGKKLKRGRKYYVRIRAYKKYKVLGKTKTAAGKYVTRSAKAK